MSDEIQSPSPLAELMAAQLDAIFTSGVVTSFVYHRAGMAGVALDAVVDQYPARLSGVNPGDVRVRVRAGDLAAVLSPGPPDYVTDALGVTGDVLSSVVEFGGAGLALQCRRPGSQALLQGIRQRALDDVGGNQTFVEASGASQISLQANFGNAAVDRTSTYNLTGVDPALEQEVTVYLTLQRSEGPVAVDLTMAVQVAGMAVFSWTPATGTAAGTWYATYCLRYHPVAQKWIVV